MRCPFQGSCAADACVGSGLCLLQIEEQRGCGPGTRTKRQEERDRAHREALARAKWEAVMAGRGRRTA